MVHAAGTGLVLRSTTPVSTESPRRTSPRFTSGVSSTTSGPCNAPQQPTQGPQHCELVPASVIP